MKLICSIFLFAMACVFAAHAQPRWSPGVRSQREIKWMQEALHITPGQLSRISGISLGYQQEMDKAAASPDRSKKQARLMRQKDSGLKAILDKEQYREYYKREQAIRKQDKIIYKDHQPL